MTIFATEPHMLDERFWSKVNKDAPGGCWEWTASRNNNGYGMFSCRGLGYEHKKLAHRLSYESANGPIEFGKHVLHACDNPSCVNPAHLSAGTRVDNMRDCSNKFRSGNQIVTEAMHLGIIGDYLSGIPKKDIAAKYGVKVCTISDYVSGRSKPWATDEAQRAEIIKAKRTKPSAVLDREKVIEIKSLIANGVSGLEIARRFGVHKATVSDIKVGKCWRDVE